MNDNIEKFISFLVDLSVILTLLIQECQNISLSKGHNGRVIFLFCQSGIFYCENKKKGTRLKIHVCSEILKMNSLNLFWCSAHFGVSKYAGNCG